MDRSWAQDGAPWRIWSRSCRKTPIDCTTGHHRCSQYLGDGQELGAGWGAVEYLEQDLWPPSKSCGSTGRAPYIRRVLPIWPGARPFRADVQWLLTLPVRCRRGTTRSVRFSHAVPRRCAGSRRRSWTPNTRAVTPTGSSAAACWCRRRRRGSRSWLSCFCCSALLLRGPRARVRRLAGGWR